MSLVRRLRGVIVMTIVWALAWAIVTLPWAIYVTSRNAEAVFDVQVWPPTFWQVVIPAAIWGAASGVTFAFFVALRGSRRGWSALGARDVAIWGALSGLAAPIALALILIRWLSRASVPRLVTLVLISVVINGALAAVTIVLARRTTSVAVDTQTSA